MPNVPDPRLPVESARRLDLARLDPHGPLLIDKDDAPALVASDQEAIGELTWKLHAEGRRALLVVLQGMDASGKDGVAGGVFREVNPTVVSVSSFRRPSDEELDHDYLWRVHRECPAAGQVRIFNRSHYEDVAVVRVHAPATRGRWTARFRQINDFERLLSENGTTIVKLFLHISRDEQAVQLRERLQDPRKHWKFQVGDLAERARWDDYQKAYGEALAQTSTAWAPWHIVPADRAWYRNWVAGQIVRRALERMKPAYPPLAAEAVGVEVL